MNTTGQCIGPVGDQIGMHANIDTVCRKKIVTTLLLRQIETNFLNHCLDINAECVVHHVEQYIKHALLSAVIFYLKYSWALIAIAIVLLVRNILRLCSQVSVSFSFTMFLNIWQWSCIFKLARSFIFNSQWEFVQISKNPSRKKKKNNQCRY